MATHSSILAWRIPQAEKPGRLQFIGLQRVGNGWSNLAHTHNNSKGWCPHDKSCISIRPDILFKLANLTKRNKYEQGLSSEILYFHVKQEANTALWRPCYTIHFEICNSYIQKTEIVKQRVSIFVATFISVLSSFISLAPPEFWDLTYTLQTAM